MAFMDQTRKAALAPAIKAVCSKYGVKATLAVRHHSTLVVNIKQGQLDILGNFNAVCSKLPRPEHLPFSPATKSLDVNQYWYHEHFDGKVKDFFTELFAAAKGSGWYDRSDAMTDYFDTAYYIDVNVGAWDKPYALAA